VLTGEEPEEPVLPPSQGVVADTTELRVLREFYAATGGPNWQNHTNWLEGATLADAATWYGVGVYNGDVYSLHLVNNGLVGPLPASLGALTQLEELHLYQNRLSGNLPAAVGNLHALRIAQLGYNFFTGTIPAAWGKLTELRILNLYYNRLDGVLPEEIGGLRSLQEFRLNNNTLLGPLPASLGRLKALLTLDVTANLLDGTLPDSLGACRSLQELLLAANRFRGALPSTWGRLGALVRLEAQYNQLDSPLSDSLGNCRALSQLSLQNNRLVGPLPAAWGALGNLQYLFLQGNNLQGPIPSSWGRLQSLYYLEASTNRLSGALPDSLARLKKLAYLGLSNNRLTGSLQPVTGLTNLFSLSATDNFFSGPLPAGLGQLARLQYLYVERNRLTGPLPAALGNASELHHLLLSGNRFTGVLPAALLRLPALQLLTLGGNDLTGVEELNGGASGSVNLDLVGNYLDFASLERLYLAPRQPRVAQVGARWQRMPARVDTVHYLHRGALTLLPASVAPHAYGYQWQRLVAGQWVDLPGDTLAAKSWPVATPAEQGTYRRAERNRWFTDGQLAPTVLYSAALFADLLPYTPLARNRPNDNNPLPARPTAPLGQAEDTARTGDVNFVRTWTPRTALTDSASVRTLPVDSVAMATTYLDGLGRPVQSVQHAASPQRRDLVQPQAYDAFDREPYQFLPFPADPTAARYGYHAGALTAQDDFYRRTGPVGAAAGPLAPNDPVVGVARTGAAYAQTLFEASPLSRVVAQGAAGEPWQLTAGHVVERTERLNTAADSVLRFVPGYDPASTDPGFRGFYAPGELWGSDVADAHGPAEPGAHGYRTVEWKDKEGHLVLKQVEANRTRFHAGFHSRWLRTAYAYDDFGRLRYVLQPEGVKALLREVSGGTASTPNSLQLQLLLDETSGTQAADASPFRRTATLNGGGTWLPTGGHDGGGALQLGAYQSLDVPMGWQPQAFTVSFWLHPTNHFNWSQQTGTGWGGFLFHSSAYGHVYVGTDVNSYLSVLTQNTVEPDVWQHFAFTYDNGVGTLYKNGQLLGQRVGMAPPQTWGTFRLGLSGDERYDDVRVYGRALDATEVRGQYRPQAATPFTFHYRYDAQGRQIAKQVPGTDGETVVVFDQLDRPVLSQDAAQRSRREWSWTKYDALGRVALSGLVLRGDTLGQVELQALADGDTLAAHQYETRTANGTSYTHFYTTDQSFPRLNQQGFGPGTVLSATYYDDYNFDNDAAGTADAGYDTRSDSQFPSGTAPVADAVRTTGLTTRTKTRVLGVDANDPVQADWLTTTTFYDERARPVQVQTTTARKNASGQPGTDLLTTQLDFTGKVVQSVAVHEGPNHDPVTVAEFFTYDHTGRLLTTRQQLPGEAQPVPVSSVSYNELGQVTQKTMGTGRLAQQVKYAYNIRGWLTELNNPYFPLAGDLFNLSLHYERGFTPGYEQYNGNLTGQTWRSARDGVQRAYGYAYDPLNRLLQGDYVARTGPANTNGTWTGEADNYRLSFASYDDNGNLLTLRRRGLLTNASHVGPKQYGPVDHLNYTYTGNRLQAVDDQVTGNQLARPVGYEGAPTSLAGDFQEGGTHLGQEYLYDANGNLTQDRNKGLTGIAYNHLNLPRQIHFGYGADSIVFRYTAAGQKVAKLVYQTGKPTLRTDYLGPYQYEQDSLRFFPHAEGRVLRFANTTSGAVRYEREFTFKDHLGNLRLAYRLGQVRTRTATLEQDAHTHGRESQQFDSLSVSPPVAVPTALARTGGYAARLNAGGPAPRPLGPLTQFAVQRGDTVRATAFGLYPQATSSNAFAFSLAGFIASLLQPAPTAPAGVDGARRGGLPLLQVGLSSATLLALNQLSGGVPKGYLRVLSFNEDSVLVDQRTVQLRATALNNYDTLQTGPLVVQQDGYVSVYVGNESAADVYFDDVTIEHRQGLQVQENQYDPFGLDLTGVSGAAPGLRLKNFYQFNGKENQLDLGLNWNHHDARFYDYQLGRWHGLDPMIEDGQENWTPYAFSYNNAVRYSDPDGQFPPLLVAAAAGAAIGAIIGGGIEAGTQMYKTGGHVTDWHAVGGAALQGGVTGGVAGLTAGTSLLRSGAVGAVSNVAGGVARNVYDGKPVTVGSVAKDALVGAATGVAGHAAGKAASAVVNRFKGGATAVEETVTLHRGVNSESPGYSAATKGVVKSRGGSSGHMNTLEHNAGPNGTANSNMTSWSTNPEVAENFALRTNGEGVVLTKTVPKSSTITSPNTKRVNLFQSPGKVVSESEVLLKGTQRGATVRNVRL